jgi:hypothetical protein
MCSSRGGISFLYPLGRQYPISIQFTQHRQPTRMLREDVTYTSQYCEENIYLLAKSLQRKKRDDRQDYAIFISNPHRHVALFNQRASQAPHMPVIWDYHVILLTVESGQELSGDMIVSIWDYDTRLSFPCPFDGKASLCRKLVLVSSLMPSCPRLYGRDIS